MNAKPSDWGDQSDPFLVAAYGKPGDASWLETKKFLDVHAQAIAKLRDATERPELGFVAVTKRAALSAEDRMLFGMTVTPRRDRRRQTANGAKPMVDIDAVPALGFSAVGRVCACERRPPGRAGRRRRDGSKRYRGFIRNEPSLRINSVSRQPVDCRVNSAPGASHDSRRDARPSAALDERAAPRLGPPDGGGTNRFSTRPQRPNAWPFTIRCSGVYTDDGNGDGRLALHVTERSKSF